MPLRDDAVFCHAETSLSVADGELTSLAFSCGDEPVGYQRASLWLRASIDRLPGVQAQAIAVRYTRFERLAEIGRASCRESVCQYVWIQGVAVTLKNKQK